MSGELHPNFHMDVQESRENQLQRALQNVLGQLDKAQRVLASRESKYAPVRTLNGITEMWIDRLKQWIPVIEGEGEVDTKGVHDAIRQFEMEGR